MQFISNFESKRNWNFKSYTLFFFEKNFGDFMETFSRNTRKDQPY